MGRYWRIYRVFLRTSLSRELEFRANFLAKIGVNVAWVSFFLLFLVVIFSRTEEIAGWNREEAFILGATVFLMEAVVRAAFMSLTEIPTQVRLGTLDFVLTKPVDSQFWVSTRRFNFDQIGFMAAGAGMLIYAILNAGLTLDPLGVVGYLILTACSLFAFYAFCLALMTLGIYFVRVENLWVLCDSVLEVARFPTDIYSFLLQRIFLFVVPLSLLATLPTRQLLNGFDAGMVGLGIAWAVGLNLGARWFWRISQNRYTSASS